MSLQLSLLRRRSQACHEFFPTNVCSTDRPLPFTSGQPLFQKNQSTVLLMLTSLLFACRLFAMCSCTIFAFQGQNAEKKDFSMKCCLLAFNIVAVGPVVSYHIYQRPVFSLKMPQLYFEKATHFCREVLMFLPSIWLSLCFSSSMNRLIAPFVPSGTT